MQESVSIVLHTVKYGDKNLIIKTLNRGGIKSYFLNNYLKKGKNIYPFLNLPLAIIELEESTNLKASLPFARNISLAYVPRMINRDIARQSIALFMADVLYNFIKEENDRIEDIFDYIIKAIISLDSSETLSSCFSIKFGYDIAGMLGYGIHTSKTNDLFFNTKTLHFQSTKSSYCLNEKESAVLKSILLTDIDKINEIKTEISVARKLFQQMLTFLKNKIPESGLLKSPQILHALYK